MRIVGLAEPSQDVKSETAHLANFCTSFQVQEGERGLHAPKRGYVARFLKHIEVGIGVVPPVNTGVKRRAVGHPQLDSRVGYYPHLEVAPLFKQHVNP